MLTENETEAVSAMRTYRRLAICYVSGEGHQPQRVIWPIQLGFMDNARVVTGWCELRKAFGSSGLTAFRQRKYAIATPRGAPT
jgi:predicted DNA-binding transcriptional regulator YafY